MEQEVDRILLAAQELKMPLITLRQLALSFDDMNPANEYLRDEMITLTDRSIRQVNDLIKVKRLQDGIFEMEPVAVRAVCDEVTKELAYLFRLNKRDLSIKYSSRNSLVTANRELLYSVVYNFLLNAIHYVGNGVRSELKVRDYRDKVQILVRDFGPALPIDVWREIERGFINKPISIPMRPGSSLLGLFIATRFSNYMNAKVGAVRHRDGTSFYVELLKSKQMSLF